MNPSPRFLFSILALLPASNLRADDVSDFDEVVKIFADRCIHCHNDIDREGEFSLETKQSLDASEFVQPGDDSSRLLQVVRHVDGQSAEMPKDADPLSTVEIAAITRWIKAGADWPVGVRIKPGVSDFDWWSFRPIQRPTPPVGRGDWGRGAVDAFVAAKWKEKGLGHSTEADRRTLIRRLMYDLTGLPPTPEEVRAFVQNTDPNAYEQLVERLLGSKHYGERWARHWLDVVKYADTCGYDKDKLRPNAWPYRDYVIRSLNEDKPYSQFVQEQIAGDVLFPGDPDGILGLGFIAAGPWDFIGHVEVPESKIDGKVARNLDRDEMVSNTMNTFCSVTIQCARCHNHKFDPFTQEHYYGLQAIFAAVDRADRPYDLDPQVNRKRRELELRLRESVSRKAEIDQELATAGGPELAAMEKTIASLRRQVSTKKDPAFGYHSQIAKKQNVLKWVEVDLGRSIEISRIVLHPCHDDFNGIGAGFGFPTRFSIEVSPSEKSESQRVGSFTGRDFPNPGLTPVQVAIDGQSTRYVRINATKLAPRKNDFIFALAELEVIDVDGNNVAAGADVRALDSIEAPVRWRATNLTDGRWASASDPAISRQLASAEKDRAELLAKIDTDERKQRLQSTREVIKQTEDELRSLPKGKMVYAAATDFSPQGNFKPTGGTPRPIHLLHRGNIQQPRGTLGPGVLPLSPDPTWKLDPQVSEAQRRAKLAKWLTQKDNPLLWRSIVNRIWQYHFGTGLVATPNDFGRMGSEPTHPELLDWLACELRDGGQSLKHIHRLIVTSSVYRQSSQHHPGNAAIDSSNQYLWRMNRRKLSAEEIRDSILAVSGRLDRKMGGPGFYLFELEKTTHSPHYEYHKFDPADPASHRRSIYRFIVRSQPDPYMTTLDCADSSQSTPRRNETLTSLQALALLNNRFNLEMAKQFAQRLRTEASETASRVDRAMWLIAGRPPTDEQRSDLIAYADEHGLENLCRVLFNFSEFVFLD